MRTEIINGVTWVIDERNNRASVDRWGSEELAIRALESCDGCSDCLDCSGCSRCSDCSDCSDCSGCSGCSRCSGCSDCSDCSDCSNCSNCSDCSNCSGCFDCSGCSNCSNCSDCLGQLKIPSIPDIHRAIYRAASAENALDMSAFHKCETTHCRAGWAIHLSGDAGYELERKTSSVFAAMQIYKASGYRISPTKFFVSNDEAMKDMKRLAEVGR